MFTFRNKNADLTAYLPLIKAAQNQDNLADLNDCSSIRHDPSLRHGSSLRQQGIYGFEIQAVGDGYNIEMETVNVNSETTIAFDGSQVHLNIQEIKNKSLNFFRRHPYLTAAALVGVPVIFGLITYGAKTALSSSSSARMTNTFLTEMTATTQEATTLPSTIASTTKPTTEPTRKPTTEPTTAPKTKTTTTTTTEPTTTPASSVSSVLRTAFIEKDASGKETVSLITREMADSTCFRFHAGDSNSNVVDMYITNNCRQPLLVTRTNIVNDQPVVDDEICIIKPQHTSVKPCTGTSTTQFGYYQGSNIIFVPAEPKHERIKTSLQLMHGGAENDLAIFLESPYSQLTKSSCMKKISTDANNDTVYNNTCKKPVLFSFTEGRLHNVALVESGRNETLTSGQVATGENTDLPEIKQIALL